MDWCAKPSGAYDIYSTEALTNIQSIYTCMTAWGWSLDAVCGMLGNMEGESGFNPWRWQDDEVSLTSGEKGYGFVQYTPAYSYVYNATNAPGHAPNLSTSGVSGGQLSDAYAQVWCIENNWSGKYLVNSYRLSHSSFYDLTPYRTYAGYKAASGDLYGSTLAWLAFYECPRDTPPNTWSVKAAYRYSRAQIVKGLLLGYQPPDEPIIPPTPEPVPEGNYAQKLSVIFMGRRKYVL